MDARFQAGSLATTGSWLADRLASWLAGSLSWACRSCWEEGLACLARKPSLDSRLAPWPPRIFIHFYAFHDFVKICIDFHTKIIKEFRKKSDKPLLKGAYIEEAVYLGDDQLDNLVNIKSKEELLGEIIGLLQSPAKNVISALQSGGQTLSGIVKTLSER